MILSVRGNKTEIIKPHARYRAPRLGVRCHIYRVLSGRLEIIGGPAAFVPGIQLDVPACVRMAFNTAHYAPTLKLDPRRTRVVPAETVDPR